MCPISHSPLLYGLGTHESNHRATALGRPDANGIPVADHTKAAIVCWLHRSHIDNAYLSEPFRSGFFGGT